MANLAAYELEDAIAAFPEVEPFIRAPQRIDLYLCALGFEPRCLALANQLATGGSTARACRYIELGTNVDDNRTNLESLKDSLSAMSQDVDGLNADDIDYEAALTDLLANLRRGTDCTPLIVFDISVAANRLLLKTFKVLLEADVDLRVLYAEAAAYHPTEDEFLQDREKWITDGKLGTEVGVSSILPTSGYSGQHLDPLPNCVILFPSFRKDRSLAVVSKVDETLITNPRQEVIWIVGSPPGVANKWRTGAMKSINEIPDTAPQHEVSTFDYKKTVEILERIYRERWTHFNLTVSPLGSKLQGIGTAIFCYLHPDVKLLFAAPQRYNAKEWSIGVGNLWCVKFGETVQFRKSLDNIGTLRIDDGAQRIHRP
ncbi:hypothetical protein [Lacipirellula limnantheis]|uniref:Uncharacterized protein n=1 Tax=Lacipirellula limnantheis TaxID=2528024 RepID=A0A517TSJ3_9BACT|nr:hypothetical protein [Lacipirellula limnantheis]QDT71341.1 hypothetical protein I41_04980 [Lacipirellula limnantheis]